MPLAGPDAMLYNIAMPRGDSGRIVLEIDPSVKRKLYELLDTQGITLKQWFLGQARSYVRDTLEPTLFSETPVDFDAQKETE